MGSQVTIKDIAEIAGVSFATVSRSLNNSSLVAEKTRERIKRIASDLGFEFNAGARSMITSQVGTVAIVLPENYHLVSVNVYHGMLLNSLRTSLEEADLDLIITHQTYNQDKGNNIIRLISRNKVDGFLVLLEHLKQESIHYLDEHEIPTVFLHYPPDESTKEQEVISTDHYEGGRLVAAHFLKKGRKKTLLLAKTQEHLEFRQRELGFCEVIEGGGGTVRKIYCDSTFEAAKETVTSLIDEISQYDALFGCNDLMALGAMRALKDRGISIPADIAVAGYDDSELARYSNPALTSIHQPREELAHLSCERLLKQIQKKKKGEPVTRAKISISPRLIPREST
ncbi:MAG: LacI family DNA-binding transcriptional regulator [Spirochaetales bacterium]|nr:LacI family DNA-binding transcriptional regulator [Spirochaetales bacterium]